MRFNLSHTRGMVACAVIRELEIGVDVESATRRLQHRDLAERFFGEDELRALRAMAPESKPCGSSSSGPSRSYLQGRRPRDLDPAPRLPVPDLVAGPPRLRFDPARVPDDAASWQFALHHPRHSHMLAVAIRRPDRRELGIRLFEGVPTRRAPLDPGRAWLRPVVRRTGRGSSVFTIH